MDVRKQAGQEELLRQLKQDPQGAMVQLVKQYTGMLWKEAGQYLTDPEDIKECVNDAFLAFYLRREQFDTEKGTIGGYLCGAVRNLAVSRYRKMPPGSEELRDQVGEEEADRLIERLDLERAIAALKPEDADLIHMKYYLGMTVEEIARSMDLPYETVKKRHQRILSKMKILLLTVLTVAVTAACAYAALHYFRIIPGYRVGSGPMLPAYRLAEPVRAEGKLGEYLLWAGTLEGGELVVHVDAWFYEESAMDLWRTDAEAVWSVYGEPKLEQGELAYRCGSSYALSAGDALRRMMEFTAYDVASKQGEEELKLTLRLEGAELPFTLTTAQEEEVDGYSHALEALGGLVAIPWWHEETLAVELYPVDVAEGFSVEPRLLWNGYMGGRTGDITLIGPAGETTVGEYIYDPSVRFFSIWDFGEQEPGTYALQVPYVYLSVRTEEQDGIRLDLEENSWDGGSITFPGGRAWLAGCRRLETADGEAIPGGLSRAVQGMSYWALKLRYEMDREDLELSELLFQVQAEPEVPETIQSGMQMRPSLSSLVLEPEEGCVEYCIGVQDGSFDLTTLQLVPETVFLRWDHLFSLSVVAEERP